MKKVILKTAMYFAFVLFLSCGTTNKIVEPSVTSKALDEMIAAKQFRFDAEWARPVATTSLNSVTNSGILPPGDSASQINIMGDGSYFKMEGDSVSADLPYFGERQMGGGYDADTGIKFNGVPDELKIEKDEAKQRYNIRLQIKKKTEIYRIQLTMFPNLNGTMSITSSQRFAIRFDGKISAIDGEEPKTK